MDLRGSTQIHLEYACSHLCLSTIEGELRSRGSKEKGPLESKSLMYELTHSFSTVSFCFELLFIPLWKCCP